MSTPFPRPLALASFLLLGPCPLGLAAPEGPPPLPTSGREPGAVIRNRLGMALCWIPPGSFVMGEDPQSAHIHTHTPQVEITLARGFWMGQFEVTQAEYRALMGDRRSRFEGDDLPVNSATSYRAREFARALQRYEAERGGVPAGWRYRPPSEAEWEYACRAGTSGLRYGDLEEIAWYQGSSGGGLHPVGRKRPNAWGLHDMLGNVSEWCLDRWSYRHHGAAPDGSPRVRSEQEGYVFRGGNWSSPPEHVTATFRGGGGLYAPNGKYGIRVVLAPR